MQSDTAILIFSRTAQEEALIKQYVPNLSQQAKVDIAQVLIEHVQKAVQQTNLPYFTHFSPQQKGDTFGLRLTHAIESVFQQGFERIIIVGNDCPSLSTQLLRQTNQQLLFHDLVFGPDFNGGVFLIGLHRKAYNKSDFLQLPWQTSDLQDAFRRYITNRQASAFWLTAKKDINTVSDFKTFLAQLSTKHYLYKQLYRILQTSDAIHQFPSFIYQTHYHVIEHGWRAPPAFG